MAVAVPSFSSPFIVLICICTANLASAFTNDWIQIPSQAQVKAQAYERGPVRNFNVTIKNITVSDSYLWGIDDRPNSRFPPGNLIMCERPCTDGNWIDGNGALDHIDSSSREVWGIDLNGHLYRKAIHVSNTMDFTRVESFDHYGCGCSRCDDMSVSNNVTGNGYLWVLSCANTTMCSICDGSDWMTLPHEMSLTQIEAGDEEVWAVDARNHIFKRPVNGSGEWSSVPGEMRYVSASGNAHIWGIAPNDSLYVCEKPCTGWWQYVGGSFKQIDGGNNAVIGVTTENSILFMSLNDINSTSIPTEPQTTTGQPAPTSIPSSIAERESTVATPIIASVAGVIVLILLLLIISGIVLIIIRRVSRGKKMSNPSQDETIVTGIPNRLMMTEFTVQSSFKLNLPPHLIITASSVKLNEIIGQGEFGIVYKAHIIKHKDGQVITETMAVKTLKGFHDRRTVKELLKECSKMYTLDHPNVLTLSGVCLDGGTAPYVIMPFMTHGSLLAYLKNNRSTLIVPQEADSDNEELDTLRKQLMDMCFQIAKGMEYLAAMKVVHRDLAARNCMIDVNFVIKVADFGLSESIEMKEYFRQNKDVAMKLPLKWLAPECLDDSIFSEKSDVWAYGVTCWEIFSGGKAPYPGLLPTHLPRMLSEGHRLEKPINAACNDEMYTFMLQCWNVQPDKRPSFPNLVNLLSQSIEAMAGYMDVFAFGRENSPADTINRSET